jgi:hypothetical protein
LRHNNQWHTAKEYSDRDKVGDRHRKAAEDCHSQIEKSIPRLKAAGCRSQMNCKTRSTKSHEITLTTFRAGSCDLVDHSSGQTLALKNKNSVACITEKERASTKIFEALSYLPLGQVPISKKLIQAGVCAGNRLHYCFAIFNVNHEISCSLPQRGYWQFYLFIDVTLEEPRTIFGVEPLLG